MASGPSLIPDIYRQTLIWWSILALALALALTLTLPRGVAEGPPAVKVVFDMPDIVVVLHIDEAQNDADHTTNPNPTLTLTYCQICRILLTVTLT